MFKGASIFAAGAAGGLAVGTVYGLFLGLRLTRALEKAAESMTVDDDAASNATVQGEVVGQAA